MIYMLLACNPSDSPTASSASRLETAVPVVEIEQPLTEIDDPHAAESPCYHPRYQTVPDSQLLLLSVETPGFYTLVPVSDPTVNQVVYSTGDLGYAPEMTPVLSGQVVRVYRCEDHAWGYLGDLDPSAFGGQETTVRRTFPLGKKERLEWVATGVRITPRRP